MENTAEIFKKKILQLEKADFIPQAFITLLKEFYPQKLSTTCTPCSQTPYSQYIEGKPLFTRKDFYTHEDYKSVTDRFKKLLSFLENTQDEELKSLKENLGEIKKIATQTKLKPYFDNYLADNMLFFEEKAQLFPTAPFLIYFLCYFSFLPFVLSAAKEAKSAHTLEVWHQGYCPYCGSPALLSYLKGKEGKRYNVCSFCHSEYHVPRLQCPYCLEDNQEKLKYFTSDTDKNYEVSACTTCNHYIKIGDLREFEKQEVFPLADDLQSITLDILALREGFSKPFIPLWI